MPNPLDVLQERGFVKQVTDGAAIRALFDAGPVTAYIGYDPTAASLHVGNLFTLMALVHLERCGHKPLVVLGGGTAMVGDPSGKTELRQMLTADTITLNRQTIATQIGRILDVAGGKTRVVDNGKWLLELRYVDFLREVGRHFSVNRMLAAEAYKQRLERGLSFIEFNYQILQAYDFLQLRRRYDCRLQMGGDDQWGNILAGVDLCRRMDNELVHGLTFPLLLTATGDKMGKTAKGAVWLAADKLSPYEYYQYWINAHDNDVVPMLSYFTLLPMDEIRALKELPGEQLNAAKSILAFETTAFLHGEEAAKRAHQAALAGFGGRALAASLLPSSRVPRSVTADDGQLPTTTLTAAALGPGIAILDLLVAAGFAKSKGEARRLVDQGAVKINERVIKEQMYLVRHQDFERGALMVRVGKKKLHRFVAGT